MAGHLGRFPPGEGADQRGRRGGVGDAHVAGEQAPVTGRDQVAGYLHAHHDRFLGLLAGERRPGGEISGTVRDLARQQPGDRAQVGADAHVDHHDLGAGLGGERVDHRAAGQEVGHHLRGHLLRPRGHALGVHAMKMVAKSRHRVWRVGRRRRAAVAGHPASRTDTSSSTPSDPRGLVIMSWRARAALIAAWSSG